MTTTVASGCNGRLVYIHTYTKSGNVKKKEEYEDGLIKEGCRRRRRTRLSLSYLFTPRPRAYNICTKASRNVERHDDYTLLHQHRDISSDMHSPKRY